MTYKVSVFTKSQNRRYNFNDINSEVVKTDYEHDKKWYVLKNADGGYVAKFDLDDVQCVYYPGRVA